MTDDDKRYWKEVQSIIKESNDSDLKNKWIWYHWFFYLVSVWEK